jgi:hypothetical protein
VLLLENDDRASVLANEGGRDAACAAVGRANDPEGCPFVGTSLGLKFLNSACCLEPVASPTGVDLPCPCFGSRARGFVLTALLVASCWGGPFWVSEATLLDPRRISPLIWPLAPAKGASSGVAR